MQVSRSVMVPKLGFGTNGINDKQIFLDAIKVGYRLFDTAVLYQNADLIHEAIQASGIPRAEFFINYKIDPKKGKEQFMREAESAIQKFGYIDCIMLHDLNAPPEAIKDILKSMDPFRTSGQVKTLGISNATYSDLKQLSEQFPEISLVQNEFNHDQQDTLVRQHCRENNISYMGYGLFGGKEEESHCPRVRRFESCAWNVSSVTYPEFNRLTKEMKTTPHALLLDWALSQNTIQIPGSRVRERMSTNFAAKERATSINKDEAAALSASLRSTISDGEWVNLKAAANAGDKLATLQMMVGNNVARHRLLAYLYHDDHLKALLDFVCDHNIAHEKSSQLKWQSEQRAERLLVLCRHIEEECLIKQDDQALRDCVVLLKHLVENITKNYSGEIRDNLIFKFLQLIRKEGCTPRLYELDQTLTSINSQAPLNVKILHGRDRDGITAAIIGPDSSVYLVKKLPHTASLREVISLLKEHYPQAFQNVSLTSAIYNLANHIPREALNMDANFFELQFNPKGDVFDFSSQGDGTIFSNDTCSVYNYLDIYSHGIIDEKKINESSKAYSQIERSHNIWYLKNDIQLHNTRLEYYSSQAAELNEEISSLQKNPSGNSSELDSKQKELETWKAKWQEANEELLESKEKLKEAVSYQALHAQHERQHRWSSREEQRKDVAQDTDLKNQKYLK